MTPDLYAAWLTAGNNLQPIGAWIARNWWWIAATVAALFAAWAIPKACRGLRNASRQIDTIHADFTQPEPPHTDTVNARKEKP